jgi:hypothetical protein
MMYYKLIASELFVFAIADLLLGLKQKVDSLCLPNLELLSFAIADPFSGLEQKTDSLCLPKPELLSFAIADPPPGLANAVDSSCLLICDRIQIISTDSIGDIGTYN